MLVKSYIYQDILTQTVLLLTRDYQVESFSMSLKTITNKIYANILTSKTTYLLHNTSRTFKEKITR